MRAKFRVDSTTNHSSGTLSVILSPVTNGADSENAEFWKYTPHGKLDMDITNPNAQEFFKPGADYYLDFVRCGS